MKTISFFLIFFFQSSFAKDKPAKADKSVIPQKLEIQIDTKNPSIQLNGIVLKNFHRATIQKILGKPSRIKKHSFRSYMEEFGFDGLPPSSYPVQVVNAYYIYDELGIMFFTDDGKGKGYEEPNRFSIHFPNKRIFTHTKDFPFKPKKYFTGKFLINETIVDSVDKLIPDSINYNTNEFYLFEASFGPTSYTTIIDSLYSMKSEPYMRIYLDDGKTQRVSYIVLYPLR